jgi:hypothetical protein
MRRVGAWGMATALMVGLGMAAAAAAEPDSDVLTSPAKSGWWSSWFGEKPKPKHKVEKKTIAEEPPALPNPAEMGVVEQKRQMNAVLRRMEVCDRLRMVALQSGNEELMRQADELESRAKEVYRQQTAQLPIPVPLPDGDTKTKRPKPIVKEMPKAAGSIDKGFGAASMPVDSRADLGGDFKQRERSLINGTFMGRDKP